MTLLISDTFCPITLILTNTLPLARIPQFHSLVPGPSSNYSYFRTELNTTNGIIMRAQAAGLLSSKVRMQETSVQTTAECVAWITEAAIQNCKLNERELVLHDGQCCPHWVFNFCFEQVALYVI